MSETSVHTAVLAHGYPEIAYAWRQLEPILARAGLHLLVPDYPGAAGSSKPPPEGYDKDIRNFLAAGW